MDSKKVQSVYMISAVGGLLVVDYNEPGKQAKSLKVKVGDKSERRALKKARRLAREQGNV